MGKRYIYNPTRYGIKDIIDDRYLNLDEIAELLNKANDNKLLADKKILLVEKGSVDVKKLEEDGFYCIVYSMGSKLPVVIKE